VSSPEERSLLSYRKGYCVFADAAATHDTRQFLNAASEFDKAIEAWPLRLRKNPKHTSPEPVSPALRVFAAISRLQASTQPEVVAGVREEIAAALESPLCNSNLMAASSCRDLLTAGAQWLGWMALRDKQLDEAARRFSTAPSSGWSAWVEARRDFANTRYGPAAAIRKAIDQWKPDLAGRGPTFLQARPDRVRSMRRRSPTGPARVFWRRSGRRYCDAGRFVAG
jgi:hypothetical protein